LRVCRVHPRRVRGEEAELFWVLSVLVAVAGPKFPMSPCLKSHVCATSERDPIAVDFV